MNRTRYSRRGLTLLEVIVSLILVSTIVLASITASANLMRNKSQSMESVDGQELAFQVLDEVTSQEFQDLDSDRVFGRETSETASNRTDFDDVDDYNGYTSSPATHRDGTTIAGYENWSFSVRVSPANPSGSGIVASSNDDAPLRLVTVTCTSPSGSTSAESMLVSVVRGNQAANASHEKWRRVTLTFSNQRKIDISVPLRNQPDPGVTY